MNVKGTLGVNAAIVDITVIPFLFIYIFYVSVAYNTHKNTSEAD